MNQGIEAVEVNAGLTLADLDALLAGDEPRQTDGPKGYSMNELMDSTGSCQQVIQMRLRKLKAAGKLHVGTERREGIDGRMHPVPVYFIG